jgi:hypothetical protein
MASASQGEIAMLTQTALSRTQIRSVTALEPRGTHAAAAGNAPTENALEALDLMGSPMTYGTNE